ncbi:hypothetical protein ACFVIM_14195 [Streptomyces sp. NPDC057638]|uniref:hypothetical protein n=1 Tax=Streptomyces sp. NPDC057638 TaxID=3346190 RepID=UPI0036ABB1D2
MAEGPIAQSEIAALTRRFEEAQEKNDREFTIIKADLTALRFEVTGLKATVERNHAQIMELLSQLVGQKSDGA